MWRKILHVLLSTHGPHIANSWEMIIINTTWSMIQIQYIRQAAWAQNQTFLNSGKNSDPSLLKTTHVSMGKQSYGLNTNLCYYMYYPAGIQYKSASL